MSNPYAQMGFGGDYSTGYTDPFGSSFSNPFSGGYGTSFGGRGMGGGMGGYNQFGGYGQVGLGYLPPQQPTINDTVANQFMQQYYGGAFGLGGQPQPRRQRPRNPFRNRLEAQPYAMPSQEVTPNYPVGASLPSAEPQVMAFADTRAPSVSQEDLRGPLPPSNLSGMSFDAGQSITPRIDPSLLAELSYLRF